MLYSWILKFSGSLDVNSHVTIRFVTYAFLQVLHCNRQSISIGFRDIKDQINRSHDLDLSRSHDIIRDVTIRLPLVYMISYRCSIDTDLLTRTIFEILSLIGIWVATLTFQGHVTCSVRWPFDSPYTISCKCSIGTDILSPTDFEILSTKCIEVTTLNFQGHVTIRLALCDFL